MEISTSYSGRVSFTIRHDKSPVYFGTSGSNRANYEPQEDLQFSSCSRSIRQRSSISRYETRVLPSGFRTRRRFLTIKVMRERYCSFVSFKFDDVTG